MQSRLPNLRHSVVLFTLLGFAGAAHAQGKQSPEPHTAAAVIAVDEGWSKAETTGDSHYVDALLLPEYRSSSADGSTHDKAAILANTAINAGGHDGTAKVDSWKASHPYRTSVLMMGNTAVVTFALDKGPDPKPVMSCDIFVYKDGHWHALYSQHSDAGR